MTLVFRTPHFLRFVNQIDRWLNLYFWKEIYEIGDDFSAMIIFLYNENANGLRLCVRYSPPSSSFEKERRTPLLLIVFRLLQDIWQITGKFVVCCRNIYSSGSRQCYSLSFLLAFNGIFVSVTKRSSGCFSDQDIFYPVFFSSVDYLSTNRELHRYYFDWLNQIR